MTQDTSPVGGEAAPVDSPADPFDAIAAEMLGEDEQEQEAEGDEPAATEEGDDDPDLDIEIEEEADELPPIDPPVSLTAEEKDTFKNLPREAQEFTARRIGELEKGFQSKAQEAARERQALQAEALQYAEQVKSHSAAELAKYARQFEVQPPSAELFRSNPEAYANQLEAYQYYSAQREQAQRDSDKAQAEAHQYQTAREQHERQEFRQRLEAELPEAFDPAHGQTFLQGLAATAELLGYDSNAIDQSSVEELKALKVVSELKVKADKLDKIMKRQMERVRSGKAPPPIAKPGTARTPDASRKARGDAAWEVAKSAKSRPQKDAALAAWAEANGYL